MPLPDVPDKVRIAVSGTIYGEPWTNIFHSSYTSGDISTTPLMDALAELVHANYVTRFLSGMAGDCKINEVRTTDLSSTTSPSGLFASTSGGSVSGHCVPPQVSMLIKWPISRRYRGGKPRTYLPGMPQTAFDATSGRWSSSYVGIMGGAAVDFNNDLIATVTVGSLSLHMLGLFCIHYRSHNAPLSVPTFDQIGGAIAEPFTATQRRRVGR